MDLTHNQFYFPWVNDGVLLLPRLSKLNYYSKP